jgi:hypothetical protein
MPARWTLPRVQDQLYPVHNTWLNSRPKLVVIYFLEPNGTRTPHQMHLADAERVIKEFPAEWSRFRAAAEYVAKEPAVDPLAKLAGLERDLRDLQTRLADTRRELAGK